MFINARRYDDALHKNSSWIEENERIDDDYEKKLSQMLSSADDTILHGWTNICIILETQGTGLAASLLLLSIMDDAMTWEREIASCEIYALLGIIIS